MADGPSLSNILCWVSQGAKVYVSVLPSWWAGFQLSVLRCFRATVHTRIIRTELCIQEKQIPQTYLVTAFFRGRTKNSYLLVSLLGKKLLHKFCTYLSPGVKDVINVPTAEKLFLLVLFSYWTPENLALASRYSRTHPLVILIWRKLSNTHLLTPAVQCTCAGKPSSARPALWAMLRLNNWSCVYAQQENTWLH